MRLFRTLPLDRRAPATEIGGALWFPREFQGAGRHDNPERFGCLYASEVAESAVAEALAMFRGTGGLTDSLFVRFGLPLALVGIELVDEAGLVDLDDPTVLERERLRPSEVATHERRSTRQQAAALHRAHEDVAGLRWWSTLEGSWINVTLFDRCAKQLSVVSAEPLSASHPAVRDAAEFLGLLQ